MLFLIHLPKESRTARVIRAGYTADELLAYCREFWIPGRLFIEDERKPCQLHTETSQ